MSASMQKFTSPSLPGDLIQRARLESVLMDGLKNKARLFLISAPAGGPYKLSPQKTYRNGSTIIIFYLDYLDS